MDKIKDEETKKNVRGKKSEKRSQKKQLDS